MEPTKEKEAFGREGETSLKTEGCQGSENSFLQNYVRVFQDSVTSHSSPSFYKTGAGIPINKKAEINAELQRMLAEMRKECNSKMKMCFGYSEELNRHCKKLRELCGITNLKNPLEHRKHKEIKQQ